MVRTYEKRPVRYIETKVINFSFREKIELSLQDIIESDAAEYVVSVFGSLASAIMNMPVIACC